MSVLIRVLVLAALLWLAVSDVRYRRLSNKVVLGVGVAFFVDAALLNIGWPVFAQHLMTGALVLLICLVLFAARMLGGGDAKLAAVMFMWAGTTLAAPMMLLMSSVGLVLGLLCFFTRRLQPGEGRGVVRVLSLFSSVRGVPYGVAIAAAGICVIVWPWVLPWVVKTFVVHHPPVS